jgi:hypothetical protein
VATVYLRTLAEAKKEDEDRDGKKHMDSQSHIIEEKWERVTARPNTQLYRPATSRSCCCGDALAPTVTYRGCPICRHLKPTRPARSSGTPDTPLSDGLDTATANGIASR